MKQPFNKHKHIRQRNVTVSLLKLSNRRVIIIQLGATFILNNTIIINETCQSSIIALLEVFYLVVFFRAVGNLLSVGLSKERNEKSRTASLTLQKAPLGCDFNDIANAIMLICSVAMRDL